MFPVKDGARFLTLQTRRICRSCQNPCRIPTQEGVGLPSDAFKAVKGTHLLNAAHRLADGFVDHPFRPSSDYDLLFENKRLPPKALFGVAASEELGRKIGPHHFSGGFDTPCSRIITGAGYPIVIKDAAPPEEPGLSEDDRQWAEGHKKLVTHLRSERGHGLSATKRA